jgi:hypothetical protein
MTIADGVERLKQHTDPTGRELFCPFLDFRYPYKEPSLNCPRAANRTIMPQHEFLPSASFGEIYCCLDYLI